MNGYIVKGIGGFYYVKTPDGIVEWRPGAASSGQERSPPCGRMRRRWKLKTVRRSPYRSPQKRFCAPAGGKIWMRAVSGQHTQLSTPAPWCWISFPPLRWIRAYSRWWCAPKATLSRRISAKRLRKVHSAVYPHRLRKRCRTGRSKTVDQRQIVRFLWQLRCG